MSRSKWIAFERVSTQLHSRARIRKRGGILNPAETPAMRCRTPHSGRAIWGDAASNELRHKRGI
jgi:hypothetical protein